MRYWWIYNTRANLPVWRQRLVRRMKRMQCCRTQKQEDHHTIGTFVQLRHKYEQEGSLGDLTRMGSTRVDLSLRGRSEGGDGSGDLECAQSKRQELWFAAGWALCGLALLSSHILHHSRKMAGGTRMSTSNYRPPDWLTNNGRTKRQRPEQAWPGLCSSPVQCPPSGAPSAPSPSVPAAAAATSTLAWLWLENPIVSFPGLAALTHLEIFTSNRSLRSPPSRRIRPPSTSSAQHQWRPGDSLSTLGRACAPALPPPPSAPSTEASLHPSPLRLARRHSRRPSRTASP